MNRKQEDYKRNRYKELCKQEELEIKNYKDSSIGIYEYEHNRKKYYYNCDTIRVKYLVKKRNVYGKGPYGIAFCHKKRKRIQGGFNTCPR